MLKKRTEISTFELMVLIVGCAAVILGFNLINRVYITDYAMSWPMVISIFTWLILLVLFILLSINVDSTKQTLKEITEIKDILKKLTQKKE
ncbi:hypothetical protein COY26_00650 [Candidatus Woesearchaeota archaeon CG_4_10_14_0_2_um_filter_33_10]|nr:MAG: hypothetical protein COV14_02715 [Candidatus Woesearchaeota archaeon CG10_big_fil_rev_8_21_14_0_10_33_12]PIU72554.1 MAG: hypothetical protein COS79_02295 [Candidatus Woesearchaeota archaeon CG06_land_8_20_14_3_00_33_13]PIZ53860.1 MAG: hypothetical protein COY26_00650 [Candidatus Woesearchaeota archaeon CG_4_10_14_0_2_um_filter_33_10]